jgi:hypothetical protein
MIPTWTMLVLLSIFNFDKYLVIYRILFYGVLPPVIVLLTLYTIWGMFEDMKESVEFEEKPVEYEPEQ